MTLMMILMWMSGCVELWLMIIVIVDDDDVCG